MNLYNRLQHNLLYNCDSLSEYIYSVAIYVCNNIHIYTYLFEYRN